MDWTVSAPDRLDTFLQKTGYFLSRGRAQSAIEREEVSVNGVTLTKASHALRAGDSVSYAQSDEVVVSDVQSIDLHLTVLYEDDACIVIDKPAGIAVHPGAGMPQDEPTILHGAAHLFAERGIPFSTDAVLVHRLDRETTGCLLLAKTPAAHLALQKQFEERTVRKEYLAIVSGIPSPPSAAIDSPIGRSTKDRTKMSVLGATRSREAKTSYRTLAAGQDTALLLCELHTGRTHQIRVHLSALGHPLLGDPSYASARSTKIVQEHHIANLCLHARTLRFRSPADGKEHDCEAPLPGTFAQALAELGLHI